MVHVCFVCLGNICRSPTAEGIFLHLVREAGLHDSITVASAGTAGYHIGEPPDRRAREAARRRGVELPSRAAQFQVRDFSRFEYVLAMDGDNYRDLVRLTGDEEHRSRVHLLRSFDPAAPKGAEVPDPYYGGPQGFDEVFDLCEAACRGLLAHIRREHQL